MATIKIFKGNTPPLLKRGEWATNKKAVYIGGENGETEKFESVFNLQAQKSFNGFAYDADTRTFTIPVGTPLAKVQELLNALPRTLDASISTITLFFERTLEIDDEAQIYKHDDEKGFVIENFTSYKLILKSDSFSDAAYFEFKKTGIKVKNSNVEFYKIRFAYNNEDVSLDNLFEILSSKVKIDNISLFVIHKRLISLFEVKENSNLLLQNTCNFHADSDDYMIDYVFKSLDFSSSTMILSRIRYSNPAHRALRKPFYIVEILYGKISCFYPKDVAELSYRGTGGGRYFERGGLSVNGRLAELLDVQNKQVSKLEDDDYIRNRTRMGNLMIQFFEQLAKTGISEVRVDSSRITFTGSGNTQYRLRFT